MPDNETPTPQSDSQLNPVRTQLAIWTFAFSFAIIALLAGIAIFTAKDLEDTKAVDEHLETVKLVMNVTLPMYATWMGTIMAFYFSRATFEAASIASRGSNEDFQKLLIASSNLTNPQAGKLELLKQISLSSELLNNRLQIKQTDRNEKLEEVIKKLENIRRNRLVIVGDQGEYFDLVYLSEMKPYLDGRPNASEITLTDYLNNRPEACRHRVAFVAKSGTLFDAFEAMNREGGKDVFVTENGGRGEEILLYYTDNELIARAF